MGLTSVREPQNGTRPRVAARGTAWALSAVLLFKLALDASYYLLISRLFGYEMFDVRFDLARLVESYLLLLGVLVFLPRFSGKATELLVQLLVLLSYVPMLTLFAFAGSDRVFVYATTAFWILVLCLLKVPAVRLPPFKGSPVILFLFGFWVTVYVLYVIYSRIGFSLTLDLAGVYGIRSHYRDLHIPVAGYLFNWVALIINPSLFAWAISKKLWSIALALVVPQLLLFSATGHKTYLFALPFVIVLMWVVRRRNPLATAAMGLTAVVVGGAVLYWVFDDAWILSLFTRRTLFTPAQISFFYYDFFSKEGFVSLSHSVLRFFGQYPYQLDPAHLIGQVYYGRVEMCANTGVVADGYMNFGFVGMVLWAVILAAFVKLTESCSRNLDPAVAVGAIAVPALSITNGALLTDLLTGGLLVAAVVLYIMPKKGDP